MIPRSPPHPVPRPETRSINPAAVQRRANAGLRRVPLLTVAEAAECLSVCTKTVRRLITSDELAVHRIGRSLRISADDLQRYLDTRRSR